MPIFKFNFNVRRTDLWWHSNYCSERDNVDTLVDICDLIQYFRLNKSYQLCSFSHRDKWEQINVSFWWQLLFFTQRFVAVEYRFATKCMMMYRRWILQVRLWDVSTVTTQHCTHTMRRKCYFTLVVVCIIRFRWDKRDPNTPTESIVAFGGERGARRCRERCSVANICYLLLLNSWMWPTSAFDPHRTQWNSSNAIDCRRCMRKLVWTH